MTFILGRRSTFNLFELNLRCLHIRIGDPDDKEAFRRNDRNIYIHGFTGHFVAGETRVRDMNVYGMVVRRITVAVGGSFVHIFSIALQSTRYSPVVADEKVVSIGDGARQYRHRRGGNVIFRHERWKSSSLLP